MTQRPGDYIAAEVERLLATDPRTHELGVRAFMDGDTVVVQGCVAGAGRRQRISEVVRSAFPELAMRNEVTVTEVQPPATEEAQ